MEFNWFIVFIEFIELNAEFAIAVFNELNVTGKFKFRFLFKIMLSLMIVGGDDRPR